MNAPIRAVTTAILVLAAVPAAAVDTQLHGFIAQGALASSGNELFGESTEGSIEYSEAGLTGAADLGFGLRGAAQFVTRRAGANDDGKARLDFGFLDWRPLRGGAANAGLRVGKVKNPWGLYNDSRDVVFTRPGILLPDSMYSDISGQRALLFSSEGAQLYGDTALGEHLLSLIVTGSRDRRLGDLEKSKLITLSVPFELDLRDHWQARLLDDVGAGRWRFALSFLHANFDLATDPGVGVTGDFHVEQFGASAQFNADRLSLTAEAIHNRGHNQVFAGGALVQDTQGRFNGGYLQGEWHFSPQWTALARADTMFERTDGQDCDERSPPVDEHACFSHDLTLGGNWRPDAHWGVWAEWHLIDGLFNRVSGPDNPDATDDPHWQAVLLMAAYRF